MSQNALDFDGTDDKVDCNNDTSLQISGKLITLEAWIYPTAWKTNAYDGNIINKEYNTSNYGYMLRCGAGGKLNFAIGSGAWSEITTGTILSLNTWQHVAGTYDGNKMRVYLNGALVDSLAVTTTISKTPTTNLLIGAHATYTRFYQGMIDEVRIWSICRTQTELNNNKSIEFCAPSVGLRAYYKFNHGKAGAYNVSFKTLSDMSAYGNNGNLVAFSLNGSSSNWLKSQSFARTVATKTQSATACDNYASPTGKYKWTTSGIYNDTFTVGNFGCDSIIITTLTIKKSSTKTISAFACRSYTSPSGLYTWTKTGVYKDILKNYLKCDSILTINLKIGTSRDSISPIACNSYKSPSGKIFINSGNYADTLTNYRGCDSIIGIKLSINKPTFGTLKEVACKKYTTPSGKHTYTVSGVYKDTIKNYLTCDSVLTITLSIKNSSGIISKSACKQFKSPSGKYIWTQTGTYKDTIKNLVGCDSFMTINLTILTPTNGSTNISACRYYKRPGKKQIWTKSGIYKDTIVNYRGCDSILTINLSIIKINTSVSKVGSTLTAANLTGTYLWLNCNLSMQQIAGETSRIFKAKVDGDYALEITDSNCVDTSICYNINNTGVISAPIESTFKVSPNPSHGNFTIELPFICQQVKISIQDISGKLILVKEMATLLKSEIETSTILKPGIYLIKIESPKLSAVQRLIIE